MNVIILNPQHHCNFIIQCPDDVIIHFGWESQCMDLGISGCHSEQNAEMDTLLIPFAKGKMATPGAIL